MTGNLSGAPSVDLLEKRKYAETVRRIRKINFIYPCRDAPSRFTIYCIKDKFETKSSVANAPKSGRPRTTLIQENQMKVSLTFVNNPKNPT
ncbi:hypothetical protein TNCT_393371 [Trichonephila clavata]|uniref:Uncharacterized protein n=1 Tax=Trichonephila clavata TaxID=2740835 RepID=A0A8X6FEC0_TRICU|nr:hypothetical protein TNCT_393371 [Trichonephila clavata]